MAIFTSIKCIGGFIERPFVGLGDRDHKIFNFICVVDAGSYASLQLGDRIQSTWSPTVAGLDVYPQGVWPIADDGNCYFVGDTTPRPYQGPLVQFTRRFASVPDVITETRNISHTYPAYRSWRDRSGSSTAAGYSAALANQGSAPTPSNSERSQKTLAVKAKVTRTYSFSSNQGQGIGTDSLFVISQSSGPTIWTGSSFPTLYISCPALDDVNYVCNSEDDYSSSGGSDWPGTSPSLSTYQSRVSSGTMMTVSSVVERYLGQIYYKETIEVPYQ